MKGSAIPVTRRLKLALAFTTPLALLCAAAYTQSHQGSKPPTSAQAFKNIRVLKNLPADQLIPVMRRFNASLGVRCDFCHVEERGPDGRPTGFEKDTKPAKGMARKMLVMTEDLNAHQKILGGMATCYMCHQGHAIPVTKAPEPPMPPGR